MFDEKTQTSAYQKQTSSAAVEGNTWDHRDKHRFSELYSTNVPCYEVMAIPLYAYIHFKVTVSRTKNIGL